MVFIRGRLSPTDTLAETQTRRRDNPTHPEATPICTSSIRLRLHLAQVQVFVVFIRGRFSPTDTPAEIQNTLIAGTDVKFNGGEIMAAD